MRWSGGLAVLFLATAAHAALTPPMRTASKPKLVEQLSAIRGRVMVMQQSLLDDLQKEKQTQSNVKKIRTLLALQKQERDIGNQRLQELEKTVDELESRRGLLQEKVKVQRAEIRRFLVAIERSLQGQDADFDANFAIPEREKLESPRRKVLSRMIDRGLKEVETLKADLADGDQLEGTIQEERTQLTYLFHELKEQQGVLQLNQELQAQMLKRQKLDRLSQLENYRKLKGAEFQVEHLIGEFNARKELERTNEQERVISKAMFQGDFAKLKGKLPFPIANSKVLSPFGRVYDPKSKLYVFQKGIDLASLKDQPVRAIYSGKIAYSGELPNYGQVTIIDHGDHFYSLCAHLGSLQRKAGEIVAAGDVIGSTDDSATPVYFEIRARNVAVNPLQWVSN